MAGFCKLKLIASRIQQVSNGVELVFMWPGLPKTGGCRPAMVFRNEYIIKVFVDYGLTMARFVLVCEATSMPALWT